MASPYSPESAMAEHLPMNVGLHSAPGINDTESRMYKQYDVCGRTQTAFLNRAQDAGMKNLASASFRVDSPMRMH